MLPADSSAADRVLFGSAIGAGLLAFTTLAIGVAGWLYPRFILTAPCILAVLGGRDTLHTGRDMTRLVVVPWKAAWSLAHDRRHTAWGWWLVACLVLANLYSLALLAGALAPPAGADYDALAYHLNIPNLYLRWHAIRYDPYILHSNFPQITEMLYLIVLAAGISGVKLVHLWLGVLAAGCCWSLARSYGRAAALPAALVFWMTPVVGWEGTAGYIDLSFAFFQSLAFLAVLRAIGAGADSSRSWLAMAGVCQGLAMGVKYTALGFAPLVVILVIAVLVRQGRPWTVCLSSAGWLILFAAVAASPWYVRAYLWTGNPVFPYYYTLFGGRNWSHAAEAAYRQLQLGYGTGRSVTDFVLSPFHLITEPTRYFEPGGSASFGTLFGSLGPLFWLAALFLILVRRWRRCAAALAGLFGLFYLEWYGLMQQVRYLIAAIPLLAPTSGLALACDRLPWTRGPESAPGSPGPASGSIKPASAALQGWAQVVLAAVATASFGWTTFTFCQLYGFRALQSGAFAQNGPSAGDVVVGLVSEDDYLSFNLPDLWPVSRWVSTHLPDNAEVALIAEPRGYYLKRDSLWADGYEQEKLNYDSMHSASDLIRVLHTDGIGYVLVRLGSRQGLLAQYGVPGQSVSGGNWDLLDKNNPRGHWALLYADAVRSQRLEMIYPESGSATDAAGYALYRVTDPPSDSSATPARARIEPSRTRS